jgi:hypothetical protein
MHGAETLGLVYISGNITFVGGGAASANTDIPTIVYTWSEGGREPVIHRVTIGNWDYDDPDWHWP